MPTVQNVTDPVYANEAGTAINCTVKFAEFPAPLPFTATSYDPDEYGRQIYADLIAGVYGPIAPYVPPPVVEPVTTAPTVI